jgi:hypothetical protein
MHDKAVALAGDPPKATNTVGKVTVIFQVGAVSGTKNPRESLDGVCPLAKGASYSSTPR